MWMRRRGLFLKALAVVPAFLYCLLIYQTCVSIGKTLIRDEEQTKSILHITDETAPVK